MKKLFIILMSVALMATTAMAQETPKSSYSLLIGAKGDVQGANVSIGVVKKVSDYLSITAYGDMGSQNTLSAPEFVFTPFDFMEKFKLGLFVGPNFTFEEEDLNGEGSTDMYVLAAAGIVGSLDLDIFHKSLKGLNFVAMYKKQNPDPLDIAKDNLLTETHVYGFALMFPF